MSNIILLQKIQNYLVRLNELIITANKAGENSLNKTAESLVRQLFNIIYDEYDLKNCNLMVSNYPAVDLHDVDKRVSLQVTSNTDAKKISETFDKFFSKNLNDKYDKLYFIILSNKKYDLTKLESYYNKILIKYDVKYSFDFVNNIIDLGKLYIIISNILDVDKIIKIENLLEKSFEEVRGLTDLKPYYENLKNKFFETVMDDEKGLTLNSIYVEPNFMIHESCVVKNANIYSQIGINYLDLKDSISIHDFFNSKLKEEKSYDYIFNKPNSKLLFVLGYPGQGKTSFCNRMLFDLLTTSSKKNVFYLKLRNVSDTKKLINNPFNVIHEELEYEIDGISKSILRNSITILDGLDELYMKDNLNSDDIEIFCKGIIRDCEKLNWNVIITTRHGYVNFDRLYKEDYIAIALKPLEIQKQAEWLRKYKAFHPESWLTYDKLISFNSRHLQTTGYIGELLNQPLLLYIIASLNEEITVNTDRADIYNKLFDQIIDRKYSKDGQIENLKMLDKNDLRRLLQEIAFQIHSTGKGFITTKELLANQEIKNYTLKIAGANLSNTLKGILISFYFKERREHNTDSEDAGIEFFHKSLQEYLTAEKIVEMLLSDVLNMDIRGNYVLKKESDFLIFLNEVFSIHIITDEIWSFIDSLIKKLDVQITSKLLNRLTENIEYFFDKDFLYKLDGDEKNPCNKVFLTFKSYWVLLQALNTNLNFVKNKSIGNKIISYYKSMQNSELKNDNLNLSYQKLYDVDFAGVSFHDDELNYTIFGGCYFNGFNTYDVSCKNILFNGCEFFSTTFWSNSMDKVVFDHCVIYDMRINADKCKGVTFKHCEFDGDKFLVHRSIRKKTITFESCTFPDDWLDELELLRQRFNFFNCKIQKYRKIGKSYTPYFIEL